MAIFKFLFYALLYLLIKVGDFAYAIILWGIALSSSFIAIPRRIFGKVTSRRIIISRPQKKNYTKKSNTISPFRASKNLLVNGFMALIGIVMFVVGVLVFPLKFVWQKIHRQRVRGRGRPRTVPRPQASYKIKIKYALAGCIIAFFFIFIPVLFFIYISDLPKLSNLSVSFIPKTTKILDRNGTLLFEIYASQNRTIVSLDSVPKNLQQATVAIEDKDFYRHKGFDVRGIARALYVDLTRKDIQGGSTITQQLIKSALLTPEPTISRKVRELVLAFWAEQQYSKNQILELYFNYVPYGGTAWGVESASNIYFGKEVSELSLAECAFLAGLPQAPSTYSPFAGNKGKARQKDVLNAMVAEEYITRAQADKAYSEKLVFRSPQVPIQAPHFVMYVREQLIKKYGLFEVERGGLQVTTTLDLATQKKAEEIVSDEVSKGGYLGIGNGAALVTNPKNGDIIAMVGSRDYFDSAHDGNVNIVTASRQPGSTIKLITYALALSRDNTEATILDDTPLTIKNPGSPDYTPVNYDGRFHGRVPLRIAFANSYNIPAVRLAQKYGVGEIVSFGREMGITSWESPDDYGVSITLGAAEVNMLELSTAYGTVANSGKKVSLDPILKVVDPQGKVLQEKTVEEVDVLDPAVAYIISDILADNRARSLSFGTNSVLLIPNKKVSVKTGTTDNKRDNWTVGFTPDVVVATWVGNNDNTPLSQALASGITGAAPMWNRIITEQLKDKNTQMVVPPNVVSRQCFGFTVYFVAGTEGRGCRNIPSSPTPQKP